MYKGNFQPLVYVLGKDRIVMYDGIILPEMQTQSLKNKMLSTFKSILGIAEAEEMEIGCRAMLPDWRRELQQGTSAIELSNIIKCVQQRQTLVAKGFPLTQSGVTEKINVTKVIIIIFCYAKSSDISTPSTLFLNSSRHGFTSNIAKATNKTFYTLCNVSEIAIYSLIGFDC